MNKQSLFFTCAGILLAVCSAGAQTKLGNNPAAMNASALLELESTGKGFLTSRMTCSQRNAIAAPAQGLIVYQTDSVKGLYQYQNSAWKRFMVHTDIQHYTCSGTGKLSLGSNNNTFYLVPGLSQTINLAAAATVSISAEVAVWNNGNNAADYGTADLAVQVDNAYISNAGRARITVANPAVCYTQAFGSGRLLAVVTLGAGSHTIQVKAARVDGTAGAQLNIGANTSSAPYQSYLSLETITN